MALVNGICPRCNAEVQLEGQSKIGFCMVCGGRIIVSDATSRYANAHKSDAEDPNVAEQQRQMDSERLIDAQSLLSQQSFEAAGRIYEELISRDTNNWAALWGLILAKTHNLTPQAIKTPDDFAYMSAHDLFTRGGASVHQEWRNAYWEAYATCCRMTVEAIDPRVFLELEIYKWYPHSNTFLYPVSKEFDIQPILDKELWAEWQLLSDSLPADRQSSFTEQCENCFRRIRDYFDSGFTNMAEIRNGDLTRLMGAWHLKLTTGAVKTNVLFFSQNNAGVPHLEAFRTSLNSYDYYRYVGVDTQNRLTAGEHRHFPSTTGIGGDFFAHDVPEPFLGLMAVYEYILILPTALYSRTDLHKVPGFEKAQAFMQKCKTMPCFMRSSLKNAYQMRAIAENDDTAEPSKKMRSCYVATVVYGGIDAPEVRRLRRFRDETLAKTRVGRRFIMFYYSVGPALARRLKPNGIIGQLTRRVLDAFVRHLD